MGNQREIRQLLPSARLGVAIPIRREFADAVSEILAQHDKGHFYTYLAAAFEDLVISNLDFGETRLDPSNTPRFIIQSGGKMWCGYTEFCDHIARVAKYSYDALFFVGDEEGVIDQFEIKDRTLTITRVHSGFYWLIEDFIEQRFRGSNDA